MCLSCAIAVTCVCNVRWREARCAHGVVAMLSFSLTGSGRAAWYLGPGYGGDPQRLSDQIGVLYGYRYGMHTRTNTHIHTHTRATRIFVVRAHHVAVGVNVVQCLVLSSARAMLRVP